MTIVEIEKRSGYAIMIIVVECTLPQHGDASASQQLLVGGQSALHSSTTPARTRAPSSVLRAAAQSRRQRGGEASRFAAVAAHSSHPRHGCTYEIEPDMIVIKLPQPCDALSTLGSSPAGQLRGHDVGAACSHPAAVFAIGAQPFLHRLDL